MNLLQSGMCSLSRTAVVTSGVATRYKDVVGKALQLATLIQDSLGNGSGERIAIMAPPGRQYIEATLGAWLAGSIAVPLSLHYPAEQMQYVLEDAQASLVLSSSEYTTQMAELAHRVGAQHHNCDAQRHSAEHTDMTSSISEAMSRVKADDGALIIYTSGTTGLPKGALHTHRSLNAQVAGLCSSWEWQPEDRILHTLPLHHIHGIVNALYCPLATGASVQFLPKFSPRAVWTALQAEEDPVTVFMGVPTMYNYLLSAYDEMSIEEQRRAARAASRLRLTVSGSAACPVPIMDRWEQLSGQRLLERYGMTETGMILSNPYQGERRPGSVGLPLPGVQVRAREDGELAVKGDNLFKEYWGRPEATAKSFDSEGYFLTGDTAALDGDPPYWRILGRTSTDIIKCGGYKISALQIEDALLAHPQVSHCAVMGVPDDALGEAVAAVISCDAEKITEEDVRSFATERLPKYQVPSHVMLLDEIPRNAMGKINKKALRKSLFP